MELATPNAASDRPANRPAPRFRTACRSPAGCRCRGFEREPDRGRSLTRGRTHVHDHTDRRNPPHVGRRPLFSARRRASRRRRAPASARGVRGRGRRPAGGGRRRARRSVSGTAGRSAARHREDRSGDDRPRRGGGDRRALAAADRHGLRLVRAARAAAPLRGAPAAAHVRAAAAVPSEPAAASIRPGRRPRRPDVRSDLPRTMRTAHGFARRRAASTAASGSRSPVRLVLHAAHPHLSVSGEAVAAGLCAGRAAATLVAGGAEPFRRETSHAGGHHRHRGDRPPARAGAGRHSRRGTRGGHLPHRGEGTGVRSRVRLPLARRHGADAAARKARLRHRRHALGRTPAGRARGPAPRRARDLREAARDHAPADRPDDRGRRPVRGHARRDLSAAVQSRPADGARRRGRGTLRHAGGGGELRPLVARRRLLRPRPLAGNAWPSTAAAPS